MEAAVESTAASVECPECGKQFVVEAQVPAVPVVVKARAVTAPVQARSGPPAPARRPAARPAPVRSAAGKESNKLFGGLIGAAVLLVALVVWFNIQARKVVNQPPPPAEKVSAITAAAPPKVEPPAPEAPTPEKIRMDAELQKIKDALAATEAKEKERARREAQQVDAAKEEAQAERQAKFEFTRDFLAETFFHNDTAAAEAFLKVQEDILWGVSNLMTDADPSNDLKTKEDFEEYLTERLLVRFEKNEVLSAWLKANQRDPRKFIQEILRTEPKRPGSGAPVKSFDFTKYSSVGSGFWISADGWILTNEHVVKDAKEVDLRLPDGKVIQAKVMQTDEANDLALLKAERGSGSWLAVSKGATDLTLGRTVFTVGYPDPMVQGVEPKFTDGRISAASGIEDRKDSYQTTVPVQHGNSGGALVDFATGWVVGMINAKLMTSTGASADNVSYAIKGSVVNSFVESVTEAKAAAVKSPPKAVTKGNEREVIDRATKASVLILRPR